jgi:hypothetical protein
MTLGTLDGPIETQFGEITQLKVSADGSIFVIDRKFPIVREFDARGHYVRTFGRKGHGPGEYIRPSNVAVLQDGRVIIRDPILNRINVYSRIGKPVDTWTLPQSVSGMGAPSWMSVDTLDVLWLRGFSHRNAPGDKAPFFLRMWNGKVLDSIPYPELTPRSSRVVVRGRSGEVATPIPFQPQ